MPLKMFWTFFILADGHPPKDIRLCPGNSRDPAPVPKVALLFLWQDIHAIPVSPKFPQMAIQIPF